MTDTYALMKLLSIRYHLRAFSLIANSVASEAEGLEVYDRLNKVAGQFLNVALRYLGPVPLDKSVPKAVRQQRPFLQLYPAAPASQAVTRIAALLDRSPGASDAPSGGTADPSFWDRLLHWKKVK
jgi:flagellar biosynthesis protein FlhG